MAIWSPDRIEKLKKNVEAGWSASQIANDLGGVTRNAVIGKVHRLGLVLARKKGQHGNHDDKPRARKIRAPGAQIAANIVANVNNKKIENNLPAHLQADGYQEKMEVFDEAKNLSLRELEDELSCRRLAHRHRRQPVHQEIGGIHPVDRFAELDFQGRQPRDHGIRLRQDLCDRGRLGVDLGPEGRVEHDVAALERAVEHLDGEHIQTGLQEVMRHPDRIILEGDRLGNRLEGELVEQKFAIGNVVPGEFVTVEPGDEPVVALGPQHQLGHVGRAREGERGPEEKG